VLDNGITSTAGVFVLAVALGVLLRDVVAQGILAAWLAANALIAGGRVLAVLAYRKAQERGDPKAILPIKTYRIGVILTGLTWGTGAWFLFPGNSPLHQVIFMIIVAGLAAGAVPILAPLLWLYKTYATSFLLPVAALLFLRGEEVYIVLGVVTLIFLAVLINSATRMQEVLVSALANQFRNEAMIDSLRAARKTAETASRTKNEFLANMSHEIRTPMNGVLGSLQLLTELHMDPEQQDLVATAYSSADSLLHLLDDILDFSKIEAGRLDLQQIPFKMAEVISGLEQTLISRSNKPGLTFEIVIDPRLDALLTGDPARIRQILNNLLSNAIKFTARGLITLSATVEDEIEGGFLVRLQVTDTGIGIAAADQTKLFQSFSQADTSLTRKYGGTGLGLAIVLRLVDLMDGVCGLESAPGQGSRVWCDIPFLLASESSSAAGETPGSPVPQTLTGHVLLVEDNPVNQKIALRMLKSLGLTVTVGNNGLEALDLLAQQRFAGVLMDCQMPLLDGYAATSAWREREAREHLPRTPVIAMTAHAMKGDREECLASGMDDYLAKPVTKEALAAILHIWLPGPLRREV
jgi:signal transduction histidine kinase